MTEHTPDTPREEIPSSDTTRKYRTGIILVIIFGVVLVGIAILLNVGESDLPEDIDPVTFTPEAQREDPAVDEPIIDEPVVDEPDEELAVVGEPIEVGELTYVIDEVSAVEELETGERAPEGQTFLVMGMTVLSVGEEARIVSVENVEIRHGEDQFYSRSASLTRALDAMSEEDLMTTELTPLIPARMVAAFVVPQDLVDSDFFIVVTDQERPTVEAVEVRVTTEDLEPEFDLDDLI